MAAAARVARVRAAARASCQTLDEGSGDEGGDDEGGDGGDGDVFRAQLEKGERPAAKFW